MEILKAEKINKSFGDKQVLKDVSITLNEGEIVSLLGVSGAGKSTLFNVLSGIYAPDNDDGKIYLKGEDVTSSPGKISYMLQKDLLFEYRKVIDNVCLPLILNGMSKKQARAKADPYFKTFGLQGTQMKYPAQLSGGMRQRAALLRTYLSSNGVALLDEPFSALDTITKGKIHKWYLDVMQEINLSTVFITHDIDEAILLSDRIYILSGEPGTISREIELNIPRPRPADFNLTQEFLQYKRQVVQALHL
jgi:ABC-type nitrate/sulfonate/bicarbonate transport system ATPase subunit